MKKETGVAAILGIIVGFIVVVGVMIWQTNVSQKQKSKTIINQAQISPTPAGVSFKTLAISQPQDLAIVNEKTITIKGKVNKGSLIVIQSPIKNATVKNADEEFSVDFPLAFGENVIHIVAYPTDPQLATQEKDLKIYYLDEQ
jgi:hypothetical protein